MTNEHLPWESVPGPRYYPQELKPRKQWVTVGSWFVSLLLIVGGVVTRYRVAAVFGILYILALVMKKTVAVTSRGVETFYQMRITTNYNFLSWQDIVLLTREDRNHPVLEALYFGYGDRAKRLFFTKQDVEKIIALAMEQNPKIVVKDAKQGQVTAPKKGK